MTPAQASAILRQMASKIEASKKPRVELVARDLKRVLAAMGKSFSLKSPAFDDPNWITEHFGDDPEQAAQMEDEALQTILEATGCSLQSSGGPGEFSGTCPDDAALQKLRDFLDNATSERADDPSELFTGLMGYNYQ